MSRFLEAGWWVVGPYPSDLDTSCPPERNADPSQPAAAVDRLEKLAWQAVSTHVPSGSLQLAGVVPPSTTASLYCLAYVYADRDRTASLRVRGNGDMRMWVNQQRVFDGFTAWQLAGVPTPGFPSRCAWP